MPRGKKERTAAHTGSHSKKQPEPPPKEQKKTKQNFYLVHEGSMTLLKHIFLLETWGGVLVCTPPPPPLHRDPLDQLEEILVRTRPENHKSPPRRVTRTQIAEAIGDGR